MRRVLLTKSNSLGVMGGCVAGKWEGPSSCLTSVSHFDLCTLNVPFGSPSLRLPLFQSSLPPSLILLQGAWSVCSPSPAPQGVSQESTLQTNPKKKNISSSPSSSSFRRHHPLHFIVTAIIISRSIRVGKGIKIPPLACECRVERAGRPRRWHFLSFCKCEPRNSALLASPTSFLFTSHINSDILDHSLHHLASSFMYRMVSAAQSQLDQVLPKSLHYNQ